MQQYVATIWVVVSTMILLSLTVNVFPYGGQLSALQTPSTSTAASSKPGCMFGITNDVNGCGISGFFTCASIGTDQPAPGHNQQCELCRVWQIQVQAQQKHIKTWRDCNGDGVADCEYWYAWPFPKCIQTGDEIACEMCPQKPETGL